LLSLVRISYAASDIISGVLHDSIAPFPIIHEMAAVAIPAKFFYFL
jgi:hypothetical protein